MGIANGIRKQARKIAIEREMRLSSWANSLKAATEQMESTAPVRRGRTTCGTGAGRLCRGFSLT